MKRVRTIKPGRVTPSLLADTYLLPRSRSGGTVIWMPGQDLCAGSFVSDVCSVFTLFQGRPDIVWRVETTETSWTGFQSWLAATGPRSIARDCSRAWDELWGTGELLKPGRLDCVTSQTPELSVICEYGAPPIDCELRHRPSRLSWMRRVGCHVWSAWPLRNVVMDVV